jgi:hypothetical protein
MSLSKVTIKCECKAYEVFKNACKEINLIPDKVYKDKENEYLICWDWLKWDSNDNSIIQVMKYLDNEMCNKKDYGYKFIRMGEEIGDIEIRQNSHLEIAIIREFILPNGLQEIEF